MRIIITIALLCFSFLAVADDSTIGTELASYADGKQFLFKVTREQLLKGPVWALDADHPPLSPRTTRKLARKRMDERVSDGKEWDFKRVCLEDMGDGLHWIYVVEFQPPLSKRRGFHEASEFPFRIVVLMDGTVVQPTTKESKVKGIDWEGIRK